MTLRTFALPDHDETNSSSERAVVVRSRRDAPGQRLLGFTLIGLMVLPTTVGAQANPVVSDATSRAVTVQASYTGDVFANVSGGRRRDVAYLDNLNLTVALRLGGIVGWHGASLYLSGLSNHGGDPSGFVGDAQGVNNIEAVNAWRLYELWLQQRGMNDRLSFLVGLYDLNTEFDVIQSAAVLLNSSFGMGAEFAFSRETGPSTFPVTSFGARLRVAPTPALYGQFTVLDGVPGNPTDPGDTHIEFASGDGALMAAEVGFLLGGTLTDAEPERVDQTRRRRLVSRHETATYGAKLALGAWGYTAEFAQFLDVDGDGNRDGQSGNWGFYALAEAQLSSEVQDRAQGLWVFARGGIADPSVNRFASYSGAGVIYRGIIPGRDDDVVGLAMAAAHNGADYRTAERATGRSVSRSEVALEFTYSAALIANLAVQTDLQYVIDPNTDPVIADALVVGLRLQYAY